MEGGNREAGWRGRRRRRRRRVSQGSASHYVMNVSLILMTCTPKKKETLRRVTKALVLIWLYLYLYVR